MKTAIDSSVLLAIFNGEADATSWMDRLIQARREGRLVVCDVVYAELMRDPIAAIARVYARFDLPFSAEAESRMRGYLAAKPKGRHGAHRYEFADTGFDRDAERRRFAAYQARYGVPAEE